MLGQLQKALQLLDQILKKGGSVLFSTGSAAFESQPETFATIAQKTNLPQSQPRTLLGQTHDGDSTTVKGGQMRPPTMPSRDQLRQQPASLEPSQRLTPSDASQRPLSQLRHSSSELSILHGHGFTRTDTKPQHYPFSDDGTPSSIPRPTIAYGQELWPTYFLVVSSDFQK